MVRTTEPRRSEGDAVALLEVRGLTRRFGTVTVLDGLDLDVNPGHAMALVGPNGVGKSTALRCIVGTDTPTAGTVQLHGRPLDERDPVVRRALAVVMDDLDFFPDLSVGEHLDLFAKAHGLADAEERVDETLGELGLADQADQLPGSLSAGQRRRLGLAAALVRPKLVLVLDEPEARLDDQGRAWLAGRLREEKGHGVAIVMASHDADLVAAVADGVVDLSPTGERR
jgi:ABC-type multidrug transport system ATPase subunit